MYITILEFKNGSVNSLSLLFFLNNLGRANKLSYIGESFRMLKNAPHAHALHLQNILEIKCGSHRRWQVTKRDRKCVQKTNELLYRPTACMRILSLLMGDRIAG